MKIVLKGGLGGKKIWGWNAKTFLVLGWQNFWVVANYFPGCGGKFWGVTWQKKLGWDGEKFFGRCAKFLAVGWNIFLGWHDQKNFGGWVAK